MIIPYNDERLIRQSIELYEKTKLSKYLNVLYISIYNFVKVLVVHKYRLCDSIKLDLIAHNIASESVIRFKIKNDFRICTRFLQLEIKRYFNPQHIGIVSISPLECISGIKTVTQALSDTRFLVKEIVLKFQQVVKYKVPIKDNQLVNIIMYLSISFIDRQKNLNRSQLCSNGMLINYFSIYFKSLFKQELNTNE